MIVHTVKITGSQKPTYWYSKLIGSEYLVYETHGNIFDYIVIEPERKECTFLIEAKDCVIIKTEMVD